MVVWMTGTSADSEGGTGASDIYGAVVNSSGTIIVPATNLTPIANDQMYPSLVYNPAINKFMLVYQNYNSVKSVNEISGALISYNGNTLLNGYAQGFIFSIFIIRL